MLLPSGGWFAREDDENRSKGTCRACGVCTFIPRPWCQKVPILVPIADSFEQEIYWVNVACKDIFLHNTQGRELSLDEVEIFRVMES